MTKLFTILITMITIISVFTGCDTNTDTQITSVKIQNIFPPMGSLTSHNITAADFSESLEDRRPVSVDFESVLNIGGENIRILSTNYHTSDSISHHGQLMYIGADGKLYPIDGLNGVVSFSQIGDRYFIDRGGGREINLTYNNGVVSFDGNFEATDNNAMYIEVYKDDVKHLLGITSGGIYEYKTNDINNLDFDSDDRITLNDVIKLDNLTVDLNPGRFISFPNNKVISIYHNSSNNNDSIVISDSITEQPILLEGISINNTTHKTIKSIEMVPLPQGVDLSSQPTIKIGIIYYKDNVYDDYGNFIPVKLTEEVANPYYTAPQCSATEHLENDICTSNTKDISCDTNNNNPSNSTDIIADVTITWNSTTQSWPPAPACDWDCNNDYHKNLNQCAPNEITTQCADNIQNTPCEVNTLIDVTSVWDSQLNQYVTPECETTFLSNHHEIGDRCVSNTEQVHCTEVTIENGTSIDAMVTINWVNNAWEDVPNCDFSCNEGYHKDGLTCVANTLNCNANQHEENDSCVDNTKQVHCNEVIVENGNSIDELLTVNWINNRWEDIPDCDFACNEDYHKTDDGNACVEDEVSLCKNITCGKYSTCNESTGICECNSPREAYGEDAECVTKQEVVAFNFIKSEITVNYSKLSEVNSLNKIAETYIYKGLSIKPLFKTDGSLSEIEFYNITDDYISVKLDTNKDNDLEEIILEAGRTITLEITAIVKNNDINNLDTEYTLGSTWVADMPSGYRVIKSGEKIDLRLPTEGDGSTYTMIGGVGTDYAIEKKYISDKNGNETERILYTSRYQEAHPDSYMTITDSDNKTDILKATEEFKVLSMDIETKEIYVNYKYADNLKIDFSTGEITKTDKTTTPASKTSSDSGCNYSANSNNNLPVLIFFIAILYFRKKRV